MFHIFPRMKIENVKATDTITGTSEKVGSLNECIKMCEKSEDCDYGYFVHMLIDSPMGPGLCFPLSNDSPANPYYKMNASDGGTVFVRKSEPFPPDHANALFYTDYFALKMTDNTGENSPMFESTPPTFIGMEDDENALAKEISFIPLPFYIQLLPGRKGERKYVPVRCGDSVVISVPRTAYVLRKHRSTQELYWLMRQSEGDVELNNFRIFGRDSEGKDIKEGEILNYTNSFYFTYQDLPIVYDKGLKQLTIHNSSVENAKENINYEYGLYFSLIPQVEVYYCTDVCQSIPLTKCTVDNEKARFQGAMVYRKEGCWGLCKNGLKTSFFSFPKSTAGKVGIIIFLSLFILFAAYLLWHRIGHRRNRRR